MKKIIIVFLLIIGTVSLFGQQISGTVFDKSSDIPVEYVNIGIVGKNVGTLSDQNGKYTLQVNPDHYGDTLKFSCIGYHSYSAKVSDFVTMNNGNVNLEKRFYDLSEVVVRPKNTKERTLGITQRSRSQLALDYGTGHEFGIIISNKETVLIKELNVNIAYISFDTTFFRVNIYKIHEDKQFENILISPIYINVSKHEIIGDKITIDLREHYIVVEGDFLVTFENLKNLGKGYFSFYVSSRHRTYMRRTSQGTWETHDSGIGISVLVDVER